MSKPAIKVNIYARDYGLAKLTNIIKTFRDEMHVRVGVLEDGKGGEDREGGLTTAEIAAIHEFGSADGRIPERSFMRASFAKHRAEYIADVKTLLMNVIAGSMSFERALNVLGARVATDMKKFITTGAQVPPPNAPSTIWKKTFRERKGVVDAQARVTESARRNFERKRLRTENALSGPTVLKANQRAAVRADRMRGGASGGALNSLVRATSKLMDAPGQVRTLIDTGRMLGAITWAVVRGHSTDR